MVYVAGRAAGLLGSYELSYLMYWRAMAIEDRPDFLLAAAQEASRLGKFREMQGLLRTARSRWPDDPRVSAIDAQLARTWGAKVLDGPYGMVGLWAEAWAWDHLLLNPRSSLVLGADDLGYVRGFYGVEHSGERTYRWTGPEAWIRVWSPGRKVRLTMLCASGDTHSKQAKVFVAGTHVGTVLIPPGSWDWVGLDLPGVYQAGELLEIQVAVPEARRYGSDPRVPGIQVAGVSLVSPAGPQRLTPRFP